MQAELNVFFPQNIPDDQNSEIAPDFPEQPIRLLNAEQRAAIEEIDREVDRIFDNVDQINDELIEMQRIHAEQQQAHRV